MAEAALMMVIYLTSGGDESECVRRRSDSANPSRGVRGEGTYNDTRSYPPPMFGSSLAFPKVMPASLAQAIARAFTMAAVARDVSLDGADDRGDHGRSTASRFESSERAASALMTSGVNSGCALTTSKSASMTSPRIGSSSSSYITHDPREEGAQNFSGCFPSMMFQLIPSHHCA
jgi:hypothetical protein